MNFSKIAQTHQNSGHTFKPSVFEWIHAVSHLFFKQTSHDEIYNKPQVAKSAIQLSLKMPNSFHSETTKAHAFVPAVLFASFCALFAMQTEASAQAIGPDLITNGDFETNAYNNTTSQTPSGWSRSGSTGGQHRSTTRSGPGGARQYFPLGGWNNGTPANLWQDVSLDVGATYELSFFHGVAFGATSGVAATGRVFAGAETLDTLDLFRGVQQTTVYRFKATDATTRIQFQLVSFPQDMDWDIDNISLRLVEAASAEEVYEEVHNVIVDEAARDLGRQLQANQRANRDARERHAATLRCKALQDQDDAETANLGAECRFGDVTRNIPLSFTGAFQADTASANAAGKFFSEATGHNGQTRRIFFGDFDVTRFDDGDVLASATARFAWEQPFAEDALLGYFVGANVSHSDLDGPVPGSRTGYGISGGAYFVDALSENLYLDGFAALSIGQNDLDVRDTAGDVSSDYRTSSVQIGLAVSGYQEFSQFELRPELSLTYGVTDIGNVDLSIATPGSTLQEVLNAGRVELGRLSFAPEFLFPLETMQMLYDTNTFRITPSVSCEYLRTTISSQDCGGGLRLEWNALSDDAFNQLSFAIGAETLGGVTRNSIGLQIKSEF